MEYSKCGPRGAIKGHLYVLQLEDVDEVKVGISSNPKKRAAHIACMERRKVARLWYTNSGDLRPRDERAVHRRLPRIEGSPRSSGWEWFRCTFQEAVDAASEVDSIHDYPIYDGRFDRQRGTYSTDLYVPKKDGYPAPFAFEVGGIGMTAPRGEISFPHGALALCDPSMQPDIGDFVAVLKKDGGLGNHLCLNRLINRAPLPERDLWLGFLNPNCEARQLDPIAYEIVGTVVDAVMPLYRKPSLLRR